MKTDTSRPYSDSLNKLRQAGLRPTRQRMALAKILFDEGGCHITAETLLQMANDRGVSVSLATIYNTLQCFTASGLLQEILVEPGRSYFDSSTHKHYHYFYEKSGKLEDIPEGALNISRLPEPPHGSKISRVDVIVRLNS